MRFASIVLLTLAVTSGAFAADAFKSITGPAPYRVYQRSADNTAAIEVSGELVSGLQGSVEARLLKAGKVMPGFDWKVISTGSSFAGKVEKVPVGGPYTLEVRAKDGGPSAVKIFPGILVGDLWIMAGQSNMEGCGKLTKIEEADVHVNALYFGDKWGVAEDPLCWFNEGSDPVHWSDPEDPSVREANAQRDRLDRDFGAGPCVRFGKEMYNATGVPIGLVVCPHGGTNLEQWSPKLKDLGGKSLYGSMMRRVNLAGGKVAGCLWYQGEADAIDLDGKDYKENTINFIKSLRADLGQPNMPFIYVQLGPYRIWGLAKSPRPGWNKVQFEQLQLESEVPNVAFVAAIDGTNSDPIHLDSASQSRLGVRFSKLARRMVFGEKFEIGPRPVKFEFVGNSRTIIKVTYAHVNGTLTPARNIRGFLIEKDDKGIPVKSCVRCADGKSVLITLISPAPEGANIWYGRGLYPVVNLYDSEDFLAPVFGPIKLPERV